jgi:transposase
VTASATTLTDIFGVGPIIAGMLIGYSGDVTRFATAGHFAAYNGTAPVEFSSSGRTVHRLSRRGNRTLNHAIHMIAVTQIRNPKARVARTTTPSSPPAAHDAKRGAH